MLLKIITTASQNHLSGLNIDLSGLSVEDAINKVNYAKEEFYHSNGIKPVISEEQVIVLTNKYFIYKVCPETKRLGHFAGDPKLPHNCVAVIVQPYDSETTIENIYITAAQEAYIISETGVTVSVINSAKDVERYKGPGFKVDRKNPIEYTKIELSPEVGGISIETKSGTLNITGNTLAVTAPTSNIHQK